VSKGYQLTAAAERQRDEIAAFIAKDSIDAALRIYDALEEAFEQLAEMPGMGHTREDLTEQPLKFLRVFSYYVVYVPESEPLAIVAVIHGARDVARILSGEHH
jgi:plasmid stabilization system protein ParE